MVVGPRIRFGVTHRQAIIQMQFARSSIVVEPVGDVFILLHLDQGDAAADGVDRAGGYVVEASASDRLPVDHLFDRSVERGGPKGVGADFARQADAEARIPFRLQHMPAFGFAASKPPSLRLSVIGMDLDRQPLAGEKIFDQQRLRHVVGRGEPDFADALVRRRAIARRNVVSPPRLFDDMMRHAVTSHARASSYAIAAKAIAPKGPAWLPSSGGTI